MERLSDLKNNYGIRLVPVQWKTMLESGIEIDILNNNLFDLSVIDLCEGEGEGTPNSFLFNFNVGNEEIILGVRQRTEVVEKIVDGHLCTDLKVLPMNDHFLEIIDRKNGAIRKYSIEMIEEIIPEELKTDDADRDTGVVGNINITELKMVEDPTLDPFDVEFE